MKVKTYDNQGKETGSSELPEKIFGTIWNPDLVHFIAGAQLANARQVSAHTKSRGEVSGGGRKPWPQKHTGRARHGSTRSPIWKGGGVSHGPTKEQNFSKTINKKMRRKALFMALAEKARQDSFILLEDLQVEGGKTKQLAELLHKLPCSNKRTLVVLPEKNDAVIRAGNNVAFANTAQARELSALDVLQAKYVLMPKASIRVLEETFAK